MHNWLITGCSQLLTLRGAAPRRGRALQDPGIIPDGAVLVSEGRIQAVGSRQRVERLRESRRAEKLDLGGLVVLPGFVDSHTHLIFSGSRALEYEKRIQGASYEELARAGGGIRESVRQLREASSARLERQARKNLEHFAAHGTTTVEAKSGYGLNWNSELKILRLLQKLRREHAMEIVPTFLGAHTVPPEFRGRTEDYLQILIHDWIPQVGEQGLAQFCDVFCDRGAFTVSQARRVLAAGARAGLAPRIHAEQLARTGAARLAIEAGAASADHLEKINRGDVRALAHSDVTCTLLPGCNFHLGLADYAPARELIDAGAIVALATDFNPGTSPTLSMPMILSLACSQMGLTPAEAIAAATINPAYSLRRQNRAGSIEVGKYADLAAFEVADYREIPYYFGMNLCRWTMKRGAILYSDKL